MSRLCVRTKGSVCNSVSKTEFSGFPAGLKLTHLTLPGRHCVTDGGLTYLSYLSLLSELDLTDYTQVTDQGVRQLSAMIRSLPHFILK